MSERLPSRILDFLYLGDLFDSRNDGRLVRNGFTHVLNVSDSCRYAEERPYAFRHVPLSDYGDSDLKAALESCVLFVKEARTNNGKILVHCRHGMNRSPSVVIGYLLLEEGHSLRTAYSHVFSCRTAITVHKDYLIQLQTIEKDLRGEISLPLDDLGATIQDLIGKPLMLP